MMKLRQVLGCTSLALTLVGCGTAALQRSVGETPLPRASLAAKGLDAGAWQRAVAELQQRRLAIDQMALLVDGELLAEYHAPGFDAQTLHDLRSATKSVTSLLVGIALERGWLTGIDQPLESAFPEQRVHASRRSHRPLTPRDLLEMRSGLDCDDWRADSAGQEERMYRSDDWLRFFFALPALQAPGTQFSYCTAGVVALGELIARGAGRPLPAVADEVLFGPLGIAGARWARAAPEATDSGGHLQLSLHAMLKLGELMRLRGAWQGQRIVDGAWVDASLEPRGPVDRRQRLTHLQMGRLWWLEPVVDGRAASFQARGNGGQFIIVIPELGMVMAFTGHAYNQPQAVQQAPFELVSRHIAPMLRARLQPAPTDR